MCMYTMFTERKKNESRVVQYRMIVYFVNVIIIVKSILNIIVIIGHFRHEIIYTCTTYLHFELLKCDHD